MYTIKQTSKFITAGLVVFMAVFLITVQPSTVSAQAGGSSTADNQTKDPALKCVEGDRNCDLIKKYVNPIIGFLSAFVGVAVTIGIITGGIRYASAGDDPQKISAAKKHISIAIISLLAFLVLYAALQWLVPQRR